MSKKSVGVFADVARMYHAVSIMNRDLRINYEKYLDIAVGDDELHRAYAYGVQVGDEATNFITILRNIGYETRYKNARILKDYSTGKSRPSIRDTSWNVGIVLDVMKNIGSLDTVVLGTNDADLVPLVETIKDKGVKVSILAFGIPKELKAVADYCRELPDEILDMKVEAAT